MTSRTALLKRASWIALIGNAILAVAKIVVGLLSGSLAVLGDGIDSSIDVVVAIVTLFTSGIIAKPSDSDHPYGHTRAETIATTILACIIFFAGAQLFMRTAGAIIGNEHSHLPSLMALVVTAISIVGKLLLAASQFHYGKKTGSAMLIANGKNMRGDVVISASVLVGLAFTFLLGMPILDRITALLVSLWILKVAVGIFIDTYDELMEGSSDKESYDAIFAAVAAVDGAENPHRTRVRRLGSQQVVDLDIEVDPELSVRKAHEIAVAVEKSIKEKLPDVYDVIVHVEPTGNCETDERFGLRASTD